MGDRRIECEMPIKKKSFYQLRHIKIKIAAAWGHPRYLCENVAVQATTNDAREFNF
jgi:hypothetical protein